MKADILRRVEEMDLEDEQEDEAGETGGRELAYVERMTGK